MKNKSDINFEKYKILGVCNLPYTYKPLQAEDKIGTMFPCNIIVQEFEKGNIEVAAVNLIASMQVVGNKKLNIVAKEIVARLENMINKL